MSTPDFTSREELFARTGHNPWVRLTPPSDSVAGYERDGALAWFVDGPRGRWGGTFGGPDRTVPLVLDLLRAGVLDGLREVHFERTPIHRLAELRPDRHDDWDVLWTAAEPRSPAAEARVEELGAGDAADIESVLDASLPGSHNRPGNPRIHQWYGIRDAGRLVAVGADRSRAGVMGYVVAVAVLPEHQGAGLGGAITAAITRRLLRAYRHVALGVLASNHPARRLYDWLGFTDGIALTSIRIEDGQPTAPAG
ncbi:MAG: GNAT family N-acetyltransferase [Hamadaea sp.]|nr:GNAT family N-acetyltransferase [Hamadaea sp.]